MSTTATLTDVPPMSIPSARIGGSYNGQRMLDRLQRTIDRKWPVIPRMIAGLPLFLFGLVHATGSTPVAPLIEAAGLPAPGVLGVAVPIVELAAGMLLVSGWMTRVGAALGALAMLGAITVHILIPDDRWPQPFSGGLGQEPLGIFVLAWVILGGCILAAIRGGGLWSADRRQVASRAASHGGGLDGAGPPRVKTRKRKKGEAVKEGESVW